MKHHHIQLAAIAAVLTLASGCASRMGGNSGQVDTTRSTLNGSAPANTGTSNTTTNPPTMTVPGSSTSATPPGGDADTKSNSSNTQGR